MSFITKKHFPRGSLRKGFLQLRHEFVNRLLLSESREGRKMLEYVQMNLREVEKLDREKTIFLMAVSPIEVHGPHLPLGTDVFVAEELQRRYVEALHREYPDYTLVKLPPLFLGSDALPVKGSLSIPAPMLRGVLISLAKGLAKQGFCYLFLSDNHGGPRHQQAAESAARKAWKKYGFYIINPFGIVFRLMVQHDEKFLEETGLAPGFCGDDADAHAGTNETSLMLVTRPESVSGDYREVPPSLPPDPNRLVMLLSRFINLFSPKLGKDLDHLANLLAWVDDARMLPYMGNPAKASEEAGEAMLQARLNVAMKLFRSALKGEHIKISPMLWSLRFLQHLPE